MPHRGSEMESILIILVAAGYAESLVPRRCVSCPLAGQLVLGRGHVQLFCFSIFFTLSRNHVFGGPQLWANFVTLPHVFIQHVLQYMVTALMGCIDPAIPSHSPPPGLSIVQADCSRTTPGVGGGHGHESKLI